MLNWLFPRKYHKDGREMTVEEESAHWVVTCSQCDYRTSVAAMGGVRYRAQGDQMADFCLRKLPTATANADLLGRPAVSVILQTIHIPTRLKSTRYKGFLPLYFFCFAVRVGV